MVSMFDNDVQTPFDRATLNKVTWVRKVRFETDAICVILLTFSLQTPEYEAMLPDTCFMRPHKKKQYMGYTV